MKRHHLNIYLLLITALILLTVTVFAATVNSGTGHVGVEVWVDYNSDVVDLQEVIDDMNSKIVDLTQNISDLQDQIDFLTENSIDNYRLGLCGTGSATCGPAACPSGSEYIQHVGPTDYDGDGDRFVALCKVN